MPLRQVRQHRRRGDVQWHAQQPTRTRSHQHGGLKAMAAGENSRHHKRRPHTHQTCDGNKTMTLHNRIVSQTSVWNVKRYSSYLASYIERKTRVGIQRNTTSLYQTRGCPFVSIYAECIQMVASKVLGGRQKHQRHCLSLPSQDRRRIAPKKCQKAPGHKSERFRQTPGKHANKKVTRPLNTYTPNSSYLPVAETIEWERER